MDSESKLLIKPDGMVYTKTINNHTISFTDYGYAHQGPAIVTFSGWNQDHWAWINILPYLMNTYRVISINFRDHGPNRDSVADYGFEDHARDVLALLGALDVDTFLCLAASHGAWPALCIAEIAGRKRVPAIMILDLIMTEASPQFLTGLRALQGRDTWRPAVLAFFKSWAAGTRNLAIHEQLLNCLGGFGYETWSRSGRTIEEAYSIRSPIRGIMSNYTVTFK